MPLGRVVMTALTNPSTHSMMGLVRGVRTSPQPASSPCRSMYAWSVSEIPEYSDLDPHLFIASKPARNILKSRRDDQMACLALPRSTLLGSSLLSVIHGPLIRGTWDHHKRPNRKMQCSYSTSPFMSRKSGDGFGMWRFVPLIGKLNKDGNALLLQQTLPHCGAFCW